MLACFIIFAVSGIVGSCGTPSIHDDSIPSGRSHQAHPRLVLWPLRAVLQTNVLAACKTLSNNQLIWTRTAQLVGTQSVEVIVQAYNWATFLGGHFRKVPQMKLYHHFTCHETGVGGIFWLYGYHFWYAMRCNVNSDIRSTSSIH